jgi:hypothetical protein
MSRILSQSHRRADALPRDLLVELRGKNGRGFGIGKAPASAVAATLIAPTTSILDLYAMPRMKLVHCIQPLAEATFRYKHFYDVRKIPLD